jgi:hypothetical protein
MVCRVHLVANTKTLNFEWSIGIFPGITRRPCHINVVRERKRKPVELQGVVQKLERLNWTSIRAQEEEEFTKGFR